MRQLSLQVMKAGAVAGRVEETTDGGAIGYIVTLTMKLGWPAKFR